MARRTDLESSLKDLESLEAENYTTIKEGKNVLRILPPWTMKGPHAGRFFFKAILHYGFTVDGRQRAFPCLKMFDVQAECPVCQFIEALKEEGSKEVDKIAARLRAQTRFYVNVLNRKATTQVPQIYGLRRNMMKTLRSYLQDPDYGDLTDPTTGRDIVIERTGQLLNTRYEIRVKPNPSPIGIEGWETQLHKLSKKVVEPIDANTLKEHLQESYGKMYIKLMGGVTPTEKEGAEDEDDE